MMKTRGGHVQLRAPAASFNVLRETRTFNRDFSSEREYSSGPKVLVSLGQLWI
jgi:hypothetical protein